MDTNSGFAGGIRWGFHGGQAGSWTLVATLDYTFSVTVETDPTSVAAASWSAMKMLLH